MTKEQHPLQALIKEYNEQKEALRKKVEKQLKPYLQSLCNDTVLAYRFTCYTPHFCDGDVCEFGVNEIYAKYPGIAEDAGDYEDGYSSGYETEDKSIRQAIQVVNKAIQEIPEDFIQQVIGDGVQATITKDGVEIEEYEHD